MNSLPDIEEVKDRSIKKGNNAFRVYRMLPLSERPSKKGKKPKTEKEERVKHIKQEPVESSLGLSNGVSGFSPEYAVLTSAIKNEVDSTVNIIVVGQSHLDSNIEDQEIVTNPPDICQVVEVTTESDDQPVSMSELYPLQISPVSPTQKAKLPTVWPVMKRTQRGDHTGGRGASKASSTSATWGHGTPICCPAWRPLSPPTSQICRSPSKRIAVRCLTTAPGPHLQTFPFLPQ